MLSRVHHSFVKQVFMEQTCAVCQASLPHGLTVLGACNWIFEVSVHSVLHSQFTESLCVPSTVLDLGQTEADKA